MYHNSLTGITNSLRDDLKEHVMILGNTQLPFARSLNDQTLLLTDPGDNICLQPCISVVNPEFQIHVLYIRAYIL